MRKINKVIILLILLVGSFLIYLNYHKQKGKAFNIFGSYISVVASESMEPTLYKNDLIIYKAAKEYYVNDVIVFKFDNYYVVHRIIEKTDLGYITKGDNNLVNDLDYFGYIQPDQIIGKVNKKLKLFGIGKFLIKNIESGY